MMSDLDRYLTDEIVGKAAKAMADDWEPGRYPVLAAMFHVYAQSALSAVLPDIIQQAKAEVLREAEPTLQVMLEYGQALRGDWSDFDGRTMRAVIDDWVREILTPNPSHTVEWHRRDLGICMAGGGHWCGSWGYCDDECGCEPCAAERGERNE